MLNSYTDTENENKIVLELPMRLHNEVSSNEHWAVKKKRHDSQKLAIRSKRNYIEKAKLPCDILLIRQAPRKFDVHDNLTSSFKWVVDELANILIPGLRPGYADSDPRLSFSYDQQFLSKKHQIKIIITQRFDL